MTFTEAAAQVLRLVGKPLHYKEITDVAIEKNLLSHVGKSPEVTMGARLAALVKKSDRDNPLIRVKPGVFALRDWDNETVTRGLADRTPALERLAAAMAAAGEVLVDVDNVEETAAVAPGAVDLDGVDEERPPAAIGNEDDRRRAELAAGANELFLPEEDDDKPIFGSADEEEEEEEEDGGDRDGRGRRRRRRTNKRGRGGDEGVVRVGDDLPGYTVSEPSSELLKVADAELRAREGRSSRDNARPARPEGRGENRESRGDSREVREPRGDSREARDARGESREMRGESRESRGESRDSRDTRGDSRDTRGDSRDTRGDSRDSRGDSRDSRGDSRDATANGNGREAGRVQAPLDELVGRDLADALAILLSTYDRSGGPVGFGRLAETAKRRGRLQADIPQGQALLETAARADNLRRQTQGLRPRFRISDKRVGLTDWTTDSELQRIERELYATVERYKEQAKRAILRRIQELPQRSFGELVMLLLERVGFTELAPVRRPGTHGAELHLSGRLMGPSGELRTAVVLRRDGREIGRERVTELRGALHHYGPANAGWLVTAGQVLSGAKEEANSPLAAPIHLVDGMGIVRLMDEEGIGVGRVTLQLPVADFELLDALKSGG